MYKCHFESLRAQKSLYSLFETLNFAYLIASLNVECVKSEIDLRIFEINS
jgi:hypothetical protein